MTLTSGSRLGPYEILSPLGTGGMGEVFRANDPRLARAAGVLIRPNLTAVLDIGEHEGAPYLFLVEGAR
jgi:serine/threonine protein kinase